MKMKYARAAGAVMLILSLSATASHSQFGTYPAGADSANPYGSFSRATQPSSYTTPYGVTAGSTPGMSATRTASGWNPFRGRPQQQQPAIAPSIIPVDPPPSHTLASVAPPAAGLDYVQSPHEPDVVYIQQIAPDERPRQGAAYTVPAETAAPGSVSALNRQINFPRDAGDDVDVLKLQVFLDYHGYSPGEIDGRWGYNTERALYVYQKNNGMATTGQLDERMLSRLNSFRDGYLVEYVVTKEDATGGKNGYKTIPRDYYQQSRLNWLPYESAAEALGEKFHCSLTLM